MARRVMELEAQLASSEEKVIKVLRAERDKLAAQLAELQRDYESDQEFKELKSLNGNLAAQVEELQATLKQSHPAELAALRTLATTQQQESEALRKELAEAKEELALTKNARG